MSTSRKPFSDVTNHVRLANKKLSKHQKVESEDESSLDIKRFERVHYTPHQFTSSSKYRAEDSIIEELDSLSISHKSNLSEFEDHDDSMDLLPDKYHSFTRNTNSNISKKLYSTTDSQSANRVTSIGKSDTKNHLNGSMASSRVPSKYDKNIRTGAVKYDRNGHNEFSTCDKSEQNEASFGKECRTTKKIYPRYIEDNDKESPSFVNSDLILLKARFESLQTKYETLQMESKDRISFLQQENNSSRAEYEQKLSQQEASLKKKISELEANFVQEKTSIIKSQEIERVNFEQRIILIEQSNSSLSELLEKERNEKKNLGMQVGRLEKIISEFEQKEDVLQSEITRLENAKKSFSSGGKNQEATALHAQIKALENALTAERSLSAAKISSLRQQIQEEYESLLVFHEQKLKEEMHSKWKDRFLQIKESWTIKKKSLINKVTIAFEKKLAQLSMEWQREREILLARFQGKRALSKNSHQYHRMDDDSMAHEDLFSDSFKIDEDAIFKVCSVNSHHDHDHMKSPLLQKTPHFMSRSRLPSMSKVSCESCSPKYH